MMKICIIPPSVTYKWVGHSWMTLAFILGQFAETPSLHCCNRAALTTLLTDTSCLLIIQAVSANLSITNNILRATPEERTQCLAHKHRKSERLVNSRQNLPNKKQDSGQCTVTDIRYQEESYDSHWSSGIGLSHHALRKSHTVARPKVCETVAAECGLVLGTEPPAPPNRQPLQW